MRLQLITVFGGSGFVGRHLVQRLAKTGAQIRIAVRHPARARFLRPLGDVGQIVPLVAPVTSDAAVAAAVAGADTVVNLTGILFERGAQTFAAVHAEGAGRIATAAAAAGAARLLHVSAIGADPAAPSRYAASKGEGEAAVRAAFPAAVILRPSVVFGPEDDFFNRFGLLARLAPALPLIGGGHTRLQPVYVGDVAEAAVRALGDPAAAGKTYELGGPRIYTLRQIMELVLAETRRHCLLLPLPFAAATLIASLAQFLPVPPLTPDQVTLLRSDNVVGAGALGLADLGIQPTAAEVIVPTYLARHRAGGVRTMGTVA
ncbi:MAG: complex I NDUFA9 subunit family protein [Alphaproteobacteria bacterium]|nr:complex I NDUFA9 subunit family protein [Alphaproteobacteria bacterium]